VKERKHYNPEQKVLILRELLENNVPVSELSEKYHIHPNDIYNWKKKLFESAADIFTPKPTGGSSPHRFNGRLLNSKKHFVSGRKLSLI